MFKQTHYVIAASILMGSVGCAWSMQQTQKPTYFIQLTSNSSVLSTIKEKIVPVISSIIKEEIGVPKDFIFEFFIPKNIVEHYLSVYYMRGMNGSDEQISAALKPIQPTLQKMLPRNAILLQEVNFFGDDMSELVIMMSGSSKELLAFNSTIKEVMHTAHEQYRQKEKKDFYDIALSEKYPYVPHIGLGRVRIQSIKEHIKNHSKEQLAPEAIIERIQQRIKTAVLQIVKEQLTIDNQKIKFQTIRTFNPSDRDSGIKEVMRFNSL